MVASLGLLLTACGGDEQAGGVTVIGEPTVSIEFVGTPGVSDVTVKFVPTEETAKFNYAIGSEQDRENEQPGDYSHLERPGGRRILCRICDGL